MRPDAPSKIGVTGKIKFVKKTQRSNYRKGKRAKICFSAFLRVFMGQSGREICRGMFNFFSHPIASPFLANLVMVSLNIRTAGLTNKKQARHKQSQKSLSGLKPREQVLAPPESRSDIEVFIQPASSLVSYPHHFG